MTAYQLDITCKAIANADRDQLKEIRSILADLQDSVPVSTFKGLNQDIRDRADWLRNRGKR